jgi:hypothetical protein
MCGEISLDLTRLENVKHLDGGGIRAACPVCRAAGSDKSANHLLIQPDGKFGCATHPNDVEHRKEIFRLAGTRLAPNGRAKRNDGGKHFVCAYDYLDASRNLIHQVCRYVPKDFKQRRPDGRGGWIWNTEGINKVLFRLPETLAAIKAGLPIYLTAGEKDTLAMVSHGFASTTHPGGEDKSASKWLDSYTETLRGANVVIVADKDPTGRAHAAAVAQKLSGVAATLRVIECPDTNGKPVKDAADFFAAGGEAADLDAIAEAAPEFVPAPITDAAPDAKTEDAPPVARPLSALVRPAQDDARELLRHRYLCRGAWLLLCGPTGIGKSALAMQAAILWALARACFGIEPTRPLKSLFVQAEDDDGDLWEMKDGVFKGLELTETEAKTACENVFICREDESCGFEFWGRVRLLLAEHKPDILWINPALSYIGGESGSQKDVGTFLRNGLNPLLRKYDCGAVVIHHTNKPATGHEKPNWQAGDFAYLGAGSAEWANTARATLALRSIGSHEVFQLHAGKRGARLFWQDDQGQRSFVKHLAHATEPGVICWHEAGPDEIPSKGGAPKKYDPEEIFELLPPEGLARKDWVILAKDECGVSEATVDRARKELKKAGRIAKSPVSGKWQPLTKREKP